MVHDSTTAPPSAHPIREQLRSGSEIDVRGNVIHGSPIELLSGPNIVLLVNFRFEDEHEVVMNSFINDAWGPEVRHRNPLRRHDPFTLRIPVHEGYYNITVNNHHFDEFSHRIPVPEVQAVGVKGSVTLDSISFNGFKFQADWGEPHEYGHQGFSAYGSEGYFEHY
ncbi:unnamed protein product [Caenorhabditis sp. 36 PRJEB53466]|nr:unnamed protein product [Caenorhabditis sp. 36 PRJEB53466]